MSTRKLYLFYFIYGVIGSIAVQMLPLMMGEKNFNPGQITIILSFVFLAALFQPFVGFLTRSKYGSKRMIQILLVMLLVTSAAIFVLTAYLPMLFVVLLFSIARLSISPIYDSYTTMAVRTYNINYGLCRSGASLGFGTGIGIYTIIANLVGLSLSASFAFITLLSFIGVWIVSSLPHEQKRSDEAQVQDGDTKLGKAVLLILLYMLYFGALNIRISYLSTFYAQFGYSTSFISVASVFLVIPEVIFLPLYNRLFSRYNKCLLLACSLFLGIVQMSLYLMFTSAPGMLLFASLFNGFQIMIFFPTFFGLLQESLGPKNSSFGFVMNMTIQSLFVGIFNLIVIRPIYIESHSTLPIFEVVIGLLLISFIPLAIYNFKYSKNNIVKDVV